MAVVNSSRQRTLRMLWELTGGSPAGLKQLQHPPTFLICGPNLVESVDHLERVGRAAAEAASQSSMPFILKSSFDKANRTNPDAFRGVGMHKALVAMDNVKRRLNVPVVTDIHESWQASIAAEVADVIQIPAFLCRQTDLLQAAAATGKPVLVKKGQFASAEVMRGAVDKLHASQAAAVLVCERGNSFGYGDLVVDFQNLQRLRDELGVFTVFDASHAAQIPPSHHSVSRFGTVTGGGDARAVCLLARAAAASGMDALFIEAHDSPASAPVERHTQLPLQLLPSLLKQVQAIAQAAAEHEFTHEKL